MKTGQVNSNIFIAIEHRFTIGHKKWKILKNIWIISFTEIWAFPEVFLALCCSCWELSYRKREQPKCLLLICGVRQLLLRVPAVLRVFLTVCVSSSPFSNQHMFRPCLILILKRKESWASIVETLSKSLTILTPTGGRERAVDRRACSHATTWPQWTGTSRDKY